MSSTAPETPSQRAVTVYDDSNHHIDDDTVWEYNGCTFKRITKKDLEGNIVELRNGGVLSCPICPEIGVMTTLSNLVGHLVAKNHAQRFYHLWSLRGSGNNNAGPMLLFQESWEDANHLEYLRSKRLEKIDRAVIAQHDYTWDRLKNRFNCIVEGPGTEAQSLHLGQFLMSKSDMLQNFRHIEPQNAGPEWSKPFQTLTQNISQLTRKGRTQPRPDRLMEARTYISNPAGISSVRGTGQQIVTSAFRQAREKMIGLRGPLTEIVENPRKRGPPEEENGQGVFKVPKRLYLRDEPSNLTGQITNTQDGQLVVHSDPPRVSSTLELQCPWTDEQLAQAKALKAKISNSEELTPEEKLIQKDYQQLFFLLDTFEQLESPQISSANSMS
ncbi:hypothetical protein TWF730_000348 [Orbilia blumenaviensis]|uniref:Uncharacterized protein n=1 Tax=Orbilia blumenaviensis TaxID=1796055 RepID=A0AAV9VLA0_9PEZI